MKNTKTELRRSDGDPGLHSGLTRHAVSRRSLLRQSALGFGHLAFLSLLADEAVATNPPGGSRKAKATKDTVEADGPLAPRPPHVPARAKRVIFLFMKGGPSHIDTFDQKPRLDRDHGKELPFAKPRVQFATTGKLLKSPWEFRRYGDSGIPVSELFPNVARHVDDICFLNSLHGSNAAHGGACLKIHTGSDNFVRPSMGAWVTYGLGSENQDLPGFVTICPTLAHGGVNNWGAAFLPAQFQGTPLGVASQPSTAAKLRYSENDSIEPALQRRQLDLVAALNRGHLSETGPHRELEARISSFELAFRMQGALPKVLDITGETAATRRLYGLDDPLSADFGRQCLLARRFAESGVRFIQVTHSDAFVQWDQHADLVKGHTKNSREVDLPIAGLLTDLKTRGLLEDTLVLWGGEFGRTPTVQGTNGRDHNPEGFTMWMAGGGVRGGMRYGATDEFGYYAVENKMHVNDLHATILHLLGLDHERLTYHHGGRDFRLTDVAGDVAHDIMV